MKEKQVQSGGEMVRASNEANMNRLSADGSKRNKSDAGKKKSEIQKGVTR